MKYSIRYKTKHSNGDTFYYIGPDIKSGDWELRLVMQEAYYYSLKELRNRLLSHKYRYNNIYDIKIFNYV